MAEDAKYWTQIINSLVGCNPVGDKCDGCWAARLVSRMVHNEATQSFAGKPGELVRDGKWTGTVKLHPKRMKPKRWKEGQVVAMCWLSDLFQRAVPMSFQLEQLKRTADDAVERHNLKLPPNRYLYLTSRPQTMVQVVRIFLRNDKDTLRMSAVSATHWFGATAWDQHSYHEAALALMHLPTKRWLSLEPWIRPLNMKGKPPGPWGWIVAGAETGPGARPASENWFRALRDWCEAWQTPFYLKQLNAAGDRELDGRTHDAYPWR